MLFGYRAERGDLLRGDRNGDPVVRILFLRPSARTANRAGSTTRRRTSPATVAAPPTTRTSQGQQRPLPHGATACRRLERSHILPILKKRNDLLENLSPVNRLGGNQSSERLHGFAPSGLLPQPVLAGVGAELLVGGHRCADAGRSASSPATRARSATAAARQAATDRSPAGIRSCSPTGTDS